jgi:hypothetical protein
MCTSEGLYCLPGETLPKCGCALDNADSRILLTTGSVVDQPPKPIHIVSTPLASKFLIDGMIDELVQTWPTIENELQLDSSNAKFISLVFCCMPGRFLKALEPCMDRAIQKYANRGDIQKKDALERVKAKIMVEDT